MRDKYNLQKNLNLFLSNRIKQFEEQKQKTENTILSLRQTAQDLQAQNQSLKQSVKVSTGLGSDETCTEWWSVRLT